MHSSRFMICIANQTELECDFGTLALHPQQGTVLQRFPLHHMFV